jgi:hypothetical protein
MSAFTGGAGSYWYLATSLTLNFHHSSQEPTSGLDSFSAVQLCQVLKKVANAGASVLFTIHQPSSEIFNSFDRLILMNKGRVMFQGPVGDVPDYFGQRGFPNPPNYNPADWVMVRVVWCYSAWVLLVVRAGMIL